MHLIDVNYLIDAHFELIEEKCGKDDTAMKFYNMFIRRAKCGQCFHRPYLGCREYPAMFSLVDSERPSSDMVKGTVDLGWMLYDIDYKNNFNPIFFRPVMENGFIDVKAARKEVVT
jgi:CRISPR-associated protein Cas5d